MAQIKISFEGTAGTVTKAGAVWDAGKETRFLNWVWNHYAPKDEVIDSPTIGQALPRTVPNEVIAFKRFAQGILNGIKANVLRTEKEDAINNVIITDL